MRSLKHGKGLTNRLQNCPCFSTRSFPEGTLVVEAQRKATASVIFGHGLGDTPLGWFHQCQTWAVDLPWVRFVLPPAPVRPVSLNGNMAMPAWYDVLGLQDRLLEKAPGIEESMATWSHLVESEASLVGGRDRVVLAGFSQGGAMALYTALHQDMLPLIAGVICMSGYLPNAQALKASRPTHNLPKALRDLPVLLCHGDSDSMVNISVSEQTEKALHDLGLLNVVLQKYHDMEHTACDEELWDVSDYLSRIIPAKIESSL